MKEDKKQEILKAAKECLSKYGFEKTTLDDIGKLVGLNKASLYYYYKNKETLISEVVIDESIEFMENLAKKVSTVSGIRGKILTYLSERIMYYRSMINIHNLSVEVVSNFQPVFKELYTEVVLQKEINFMKIILDKAILSGEIKSCDTEKTSESIFTIADAIKHNALHNTDLARVSDDEFSNIIDEIKYTISLVIDGLMKK